IAAKEMVTADHVGEGRFGLNIVVGWNEGEFAMFGVKQRDHESRYEYAQEWIDVIKLIWSDKEDFDFEGKYLNMKGIRGKPKPYGGSRPVIMSAGASPVGQAFAIRNCDAFFLQASRTSLDETAERVATAKAQAKQQGRELGVYTVGVITCRPTKKEAEDYYHYSIVEHADWRAGDDNLSLKNITAQNTPPGKVSPDPTREVSADPHRIRAGHGRIAHRGRPRPRGGPTHRSQQGGADGGRGIACQLSRRASILLRRGSAAPATGGPARKTMIEKRGS